MRESEKNVGRADNNLPGARSAAEGESQQPEKVLNDGGADSPDRGGASEWGSEGGGGASADKRPNERKKNA